MDADAAGVDRSLFAAVYEQIADIDKDLSPDQLAHFTESALNLLNDESFNMMVEDDDDASTTAATSTPAKERFSLKSSSSSTTPRKRSSAITPTPLLELNPTTNRHATISRRTTRFLPWKMNLNTQ